SPRSPSGFGGPPATGTDHTCIFAGTTLAAGLGGASPSRLDPWSPPRTYTIVFPSLENARCVSSCPSSCAYGVSWRAVKSGALATKMLRTPRSLNVQAIVDPTGDAVRLSGAGRLRI